MPAPLDEVADPAALLASARSMVAARFGEHDPLAQAALHLIMCAVEVVGVLPARDLDGAREALGQAQAAVTAARYAVFRVHDEIRIGRS